MKKVSLIVVTVCLFTSSFVSADSFGTGDNQFEIDFVTISGDASSANGTNISQYSIGENGYRTFSDPENIYRMGVYEVTNDQWNKFTNNLDVAVTGSWTGMYSPYNSKPYYTGSSIPTNNVSWHEAAQFVNWLNTSSGYQAAYKFTGTQGTGDYTLSVWELGDWGYDASNPYRNSNAHYFLPTENEWVKAAYWNGTNLQTYTNASNDDLLSGKPDPAKWNYYPSVGNQPWAVGSGVEELNGTFDMTGNVFEWTESPYNNEEFLSDSKRAGRGSYYNTFIIDTLSSSCRYGDNPTREENTLGFRVASVPEPCTLSLIALGGLLLRKRK